MCGIRKLTRKRTAVSCLGWGSDKKKILYRKDIAEEFFGNAKGNRCEVMKMEEEIKLGCYRHYKGNEYMVLHLATHSETMEQMVVYQALYGEYGIWVRPAFMWNEMVEMNGQKIRRFELCHSSAL